MAVDQSTVIWLTLRYREQARSHIGMRQIQFCGERIYPRWDAKRP
jgi:hypothetical protein